MGMAAGRLFGFKWISSISRKLLLRSTQSSSVNGRQSWGHMPSVSRKPVTKENVLSNMQTWNYIRPIWWDHFQRVGGGCLRTHNQFKPTHVHAHECSTYNRLRKSLRSCPGTMAVKSRAQKYRTEADEQGCSKWWMRRSFTSGNVRYVTGSLPDLSGSQRPLLGRTVKTHQLHSSSP